jgi:ubiquinone/menaquinone biosynthesis C-methylase UbiE
MSAAPQDLTPILSLLRCPTTGRPLSPDGEGLRAADGGPYYRVTQSGIPLFAETFLSADAKAQQSHYDAVARAYIANLDYPHTQEYTAYLDRALLDEVNADRLGTVGEICCGRGEAMELIGSRIACGIAIDISLNMLEAGRQAYPGEDHVVFLQGDATRLPLSDGVLDSVFMLGGIHHVNDRATLFSEIYRVLKPGGRFYFREPCSDFVLWRALRAVIYRLSPALDHATERPLLFEEVVPVLERVGFHMHSYRTHGFLGFCLLMNSDVLVFNRLFRFLPGIRTLTRLATRFDEWTVQFPGFRRAGLQVVGHAEKPG